MANLSTTAGLIFQIKADSSDVDKKFKDFKKDLKGIEDQGTDSFARLGHSAGLSAEQFSNLKTGALAVVGVIGAIGAAAVGASAALFNLTKASAEFGSVIFDAQQKTGLSAVTLSTLKLAADSAGSSLEQVSKGTEKFAKLIGQANEGSAEAQKTLKDLGVTSLDLEEAMSQAFETIGKMPEGVEQIAAAQKLYGKSGADLIPVIKQIGDLEDAKAEAMRNGTALTQKDIEASDRFGDALGVLSAQATAAGVAFTSDLMPVLSDFFENSSEWYADNQDRVRVWGSVVADTVSGLATMFVRAFDAIADAATSLRAALAVITGGVSELVFAAGKLVAQLALAQGAENKLTAGGGIHLGGGGRGTGGSTGTISTTPSGGGRRGAGGGGGGGRSNSDVDKAAQEAERLAQRDLAAGIRAAANSLQLSERDISDSLLDMANKLEEFGTSDESVGKIAKDFERLEKNIEISITALEKLENQKRATNTAAENLLLTQEQRIRRDAEQDKLEKAREDFRQSVAKTREDSEKKANERLDHEVEQTERLLKAERERAELDAAETARTIKGGGSVLDPDLIREPIDEATGSLGVMESAFGSLKQIGMDALNGLAQGVGNLVQQWVLMGSVGPNAMRKLVASVLAGVAAQAAVLAIMELAYGIAALTPWGAATYGPAPFHFKSAALFGSIALATAVAGRAIAGDSFQQQTNQATGQGAGASGSGNGSSQGGGRFSSQEGRTDTAGINAPGGRFGPQQVIVSLRDKTEWFSQMFKVEYEKMGVIRELVRDGG